MVDPGLLQLLQLFSEWQNLQIICAVPIQELLDFEISKTELLFSWNGFGDLIVLLNCKT